MSSTSTLRQFIEVLKTLPEHVQDKTIGWLDISYPTTEQLEELRNQLNDSNENQIEGCAN